MEHFSNPDCCVVVPRNPMDSSDSLPAYVVPFVSMLNYLEDKKTLPTPAESFCLKIMDFGNCEFTINVPYNPD